MLRVPLALAVVDDLHRVLAREVGLGPAGLRVDRVNPQVGGDVAVEQVELEVDEDRLGSVHLEPEPVETGLALLRVVEVIDVVRRAVDVAPEPRGLASCQVSLGSASMAGRSASVSRKIRPVKADRDRAPAADRRLGSEVTADGPIRRPVGKRRRGPGRPAWRVLRIRCSVPGRVQLDQPALVRRIDAVPISRLDEQAASSLPTARTPSGCVERSCPVARSTARGLRRCGCQGAWPMRRETGPTKSTSSDEPVAAEAAIASRPSSIVRTRGTSAHREHRLDQSWRDRAGDRELGPHLLGPPAALALAQDRVVPAVAKVDDSPTISQTNKPDPVVVAQREHQAAVDQHAHDRDEGGEGGAERPGRRRGR